MTYSLRIALTLSLSFSYSFSERLNKFFSLSLLSPLYFSILLLLLQSLAYVKVKFVSVFQFNQCGHITTRGELLTRKLKRNVLRELNYNEVNECCVSKAIHIHMHTYNTDTEKE